MRKVALLLVMLVLSLSLSAATWVWSSPYTNVTDYRYQLGSQDEDGWTYVDSSVESLHMDINRDETLYVQLSIDGGHTWSPSGMATFMEYAPLAEPQFRSEYEAFMPYNAARKYQTMIDAFIGFDFSSTVNYTIGGVLAFKNVYSPNAWFGLSVNLSGGAIAAPGAGTDLWTILWDGNLGKPEYYDMRYFTDAGLYFDFYVRDFDFAIGLGVGTHFFENDGAMVSLMEAGTYNMNIYLFASASLDRYFGSVFHIGLGYKFKYSLGQGGSMELGHSANFHMGVTF